MRQRWATALVILWRAVSSVPTGSQARGSADDRGDVDLLVICPVRGDLRALTAAMDRPLRGLPLATDIVVLTAEEFEVGRAIPGTVACPAASEGKVLYERA